MKPQLDETSTMELENPINTSLDNNGLLLENTAHKLTDDVIQVIASRRLRHLEMLKITQEPDSTPEVRQKDAEFRLRLARFTTTPNIDFGQLKSELSDTALERSTKISDIVKDRIERRKQFELTARTKWTDDVLLARPVDHSFWWAQTQAHFAPDMQANFLQDGLHFRGGPKVNNYNGEIHTSFGAVALFALQPDRFPKSAGGVFLSSPHVEIFGGIVAF